MKTFEEKFTAWVDGELKGRELAEFEAELANAKDTQLDKLAALQLGDMLREHCGAPALSNEDFFNHQLMQAIEADSPAPVIARFAPRRFTWSLPRMALAGAFSLLVAFALFHTMIPTGAKPGPQGTFEVISAKGGDPNIVVTTYQSTDNDVVIWLGDKSLKSTPDKHASPEKRKDN